MVSASTGPKTPYKSQPSLVSSNTAAPQPAVRFRRSLHLAARKARCRPRLGRNSTAADPWLSLLFARLVVQLAAAEKAWLFFHTRTHPHMQSRDTASCQGLGGCYPEQPHLLPVETLPKTRGSDDPAHLWAIHQVASQGFPSLLLLTCSTKPFYLWDYGGLNLDTETHGYFGSLT